MKVSYDSESDAAYIKFLDKKPCGAIEIDEGIVVHVTKENKLVAIEILDASQKFNVDELLKFEVEDMRLVSVSS